MKHCGETVRFLCRETFINSFPVYNTMIPKEKWAEIIKGFHEKPLPDLIERKIEIPKEIPLRRAISIIGPRRSGKTYTMYRLIKSIMSDKIETNRALYINLERTDLRGSDSTDLISMLETFYEIYPQNKTKKIWLFLDEIQNVNEWETFVRTVIDSENVQVFISGSSSKLLSKEIATSMRGRALTYILLPFSFAEFLTAKGIMASKYFSASEKAVIVNKLGNYLEYGGYPEVVIFPEQKEKIMLDIVETTIYRDVVERYKIRNTNLLQLLIKSLINSSAKEFSIHKFYNFIKSMNLKASKNSLYHYVNALSEVFFIFLLRKFSYSHRVTEQSIPKAYVVDNGILTSNGISNRGRLIENMVFIELKRRGEKVFYYKSIDDKEVDFVILEKNKVKQLIQVTSSLEERDVKERELSGLLKASKELKCKNLLVISEDKEGEEIVGNRKIKYAKLWKWLVSTAVSEQ